MPNYKRMRTGTAVRRDKTRPPSHPPPRCYCKLLNGHFESGPVGSGLRVTKSPFRECRNGGWGRPGITHISYDMCVLFQGSSLVINRYMGKRDIFVSIIDNGGRPLPRIMAKWQIHRAKSYRNFTNKTIVLCHHCDCKMEILLSEAFDLNKQHNARRGKWEHVKSHLRNFTNDINMRMY